MTDKQLDFNRPPPNVAVRPAEAEIVRRVRARDETMIRYLYKSYYAPMLRAARTCVRSVEEAEEVIQDTWVAVLGGIDRFKARSSFKTWLFNILYNIARARGEREARTTPFSQLPDDAGLERLRTRDDPERELLAREIHGRINDALTRLPAAQRDVFVLSDVEGVRSKDICARLGLTPANQRVLLHRGRASLRRELSVLYDVALAT